MFRGAIFSMAMGWKSWVIWRMENGDVKTPFCWENLFRSGWWVQTWLLFSISYISFPLTFIFFKTVKTTNQ
jgi:hypothetical protein